MTREPGGAGRGPGAGSGAGLHVVRFAPAKLNLTLAVLGRRDDGYHFLHSVMVPLLLGDALTVSVAQPGAAGDALRVSGLAVTATDDNLVLRAINALRAALVHEHPRSRTELPLLSVRLVKRIPVAAGLGGGSSDAAAAVEAALAAWHTTLAPESKASLAASLGSDVPFFFAQGPALITGRGEFVEPLPALTTEPPAVLLVTPGLPVSTATVFDAYVDGARSADPARALGISENLSADLRAGMTADELLQRSADLAAANDLLPAAISVAPELEVFIRKLETLLGRPVCQSGSGPTQWVMYPTLAEARKAVRMVRLAIGRGTLPTLGDGEPFVLATALAGSLVAGGRVVQTDRPNRPHTVHNVAGSADQPSAPKGDDSR